MENTSLTAVLPISVYEDSAYNDLRRGYLLLIAALLEEYLIEGDINNYIEMILDIEKSCYEHAVEIAEYELLEPVFTVSMFEELYRTRVIRITKNLDVNSEVGDEHLATGLIHGSIDPKTVSRLDNKDLSPLRNQKLIDDLSVRLNQKITLKTSTLYRCKQCGKRETTIRSAQMRSLDEASTLVINCTFCGFKWFN